MDKMLYVFMSGVSQNILVMCVYVNNLVNILISGFCCDFEQVCLMQVFGDSFLVWVFVMSEWFGIDFSYGSFQEIGNELDIVIDGDGFVVVQVLDGSEVYVCIVGMYIDVFGMLCIGDGLLVFGNGGLIVVLLEEKVEIGQDGIISICVFGENFNVVVVVDWIKLVNLNLKQMEKGIDGLLYYKLQLGEQVLLVDVNVKVVFGFLESSNVNVVEEMIVIFLLFC